MGLQSPHKFLAVANDCFQSVSGLVDNSVTACLDLRHDTCSEIGPYLSFKAQVFDPMVRSVLLMDAVQELSLITPIGVNTVRKSFSSND